MFMCRPTIVSYLVTATCFLYIFEFFSFSSNVLPFLKKFGVNPVTGEVGFVNYTLLAISNKQ